MGAGGVTVATRQEVTIDGFLPVQVANGAHGHWSKRYRMHRVEMATAWGAAKHAGWQRITSRARLTITLVFSVPRRRDTDNLYARCKGLVDGIKPFCVDDSTEWLELIVLAEVIPGVRRTHLLLEALP